MPAPPPPTAVPAGPAAAIEVAKVSKWYGNVVAVNDISFTLGAGITGLLGPNGAGKSSLMRCIATLQIPTQGAIRFGDLDVLASPDALRRTLGYLPQDFGVYPRVTALDMFDHLAVLKGFANGKERRETVDALLRAGLIDEVNLDIFPALIGGTATPSLFDSPELLPGELPTRLSLISAEARDDGHVWLRYAVAAGDPSHD